MHHISLTQVVALDTNADDRLLLGNVCHFDDAHVGGVQYLTYQISSPHGKTKLHVHGHVASLCFQCKDSDRSRTGVESSSHITIQAEMAKPKGIALTGDETKPHFLHIGTSQVIASDANKIGLGSAVMATDKHRFAA